MSTPAAFVLIDKPKGLSSAAVVAKVKRSLSQHYGKDVRVGHAGTLDPMATGLLVCLVGRATKLADHVQAGRKRYTGIIQLGVETSTDDITGEVLVREPVPSVSLEEIETAFCGELQQVPPRVSAVKIDGKRAYKRARAGEEFKITPRSVTVYSIQLQPLSADQVSFDIECSKGTYIRSIARDIGAHIGCGGTLASLRREASSPFDVESSLELESVVPQALKSVRDIFPSAPCTQVESETFQWLVNGNVDRFLSLIDLPAHNGKWIVEETPEEGDLEQDSLGRVAIFGLDGKKSSSASFLGVF